MLWFATVPIIGALFVTVSVNFSSAEVLPSEADTVICRRPRNELTVLTCRSAEELEVDVTLTVAGTPGVVSGSISRSGSAYAAVLTWPINSSGPTETSK